MANDRSKKVGNTSFRVEAIKKMKLKDFKETYGKILKGQDLDEVYQEVTGAKPSSGANEAPKEAPKEDKSEKAG